ncbi:metacaspase-1-like [Diospyros lotus]|uniref:metacaspase-1-like n=1 Tax=Diospyros lotus TaxID=55363 RepID=UPI00224DAB5D|nr:metacaspase-1-like [Diospyros lotus]
MAGNLTGENSKPPLGRRARAFQPFLFFISLSFSQPLRSLSLSLSLILLTPNFSISSSKLNIDSFIIAHYQHIKPNFSNSIPNLHLQTFLSLRTTTMLMLVDCSNCRTPLQLPPGARSIRCALCQAVTPIADCSRGFPQQPPPPPPATSSSYHHLYPPPPAPSPYGQSPAGQLPPVHGRKKAVICGISYRNTRHELKGCINDAKCMKFLLINRFKFPESSIIMLTEEETDPFRRPTKHSIRMAMFWLVQGCRPGDSLVFHFSGHGSQQRNYTGDEIDGYDETLCPLDFETQGMIVDDEINATIVKPLPHGVKLHAIIDACHSGTMLDLPFLCRMDRSGRYVWEDHRPPSGMWKGTNGGEVISFSGCDDDQTSADTAALSKVTSTGAMTFSFIQAIEREQATTYGNMLTSMRSTISNRESNAGGGVVTTLLTMLLTGGSLGSMRQEPQLTSNEPFDVYSKPFSL